jgi:hypothetical protein
MGEDGLASAESGGADVTSDGGAGVEVGLEATFATYAATDGGKGGMGDGVGDAAPGSGEGIGDGRGPPNPGSGGG